MQWNESDNRAERPKKMSVALAFRILGIEPTDDHELVRRAYRRLVLHLHPDLIGESGKDPRHFSEAAAAYRLLRTKYRLDRDAELDGTTAGECQNCGGYAILKKALDGGNYCQPCHLVAAGQKRSLPSPPYEIVTCGVSIVSLTVAVVLMCVGVAKGDTQYLTGALLSAAFAMATLAITCITVGDTVSSNKLRSRD